MKYRSTRKWNVGFIRALKCLRRYLDLLSSLCLSKTYRWSTNCIPMNSTFGWIQTLFLRIRFWLDSNFIPRIRLSVGFKLYSRSKIRVFKSKKRIYGHFFWGARNLLIRQLVDCTIEPEADWRFRASSAFKKSTGKLSFIREFDRMKVRFLGRNLFIYRYVLATGWNLSILRICCEGQAGVWSPVSIEFDLIWPHLFILIKGISDKPRVIIGSQAIR